MNSLYVLRLQWLNGQQLNKCLMTFMLLFACVLANCAVHASEIEQLSQQINEYAEHQHDCCEPEEPCCEGHVGVFTYSSIDNSASNDWQFDGVAVELLSQYVVARKHWTSRQLSTGPPIHIVNCRFTI